MAVTASLVAAAALGAAGGIAGNKAKKKAAKKQRKDVREATRPSTVAEFVKQLMPMIRQNVIAAQGPQFKQQLAGILSKRGLTGTGIGTSLQAAAASAPGIFANQMALPTAMDLLARRAGFAGSEMNFNPQMSGTMAGLLGGAQGYFGAASLGQMGGRAAASAQADPRFQQSFPGLSGMLGMNG